MCCAVKTCSFYLVISLNRMNNHVQLRAGHDSCENDLSEGEQDAGLGLPRSA